MHLSFEKQALIGLSKFIGKENLMHSLMDLNLLKGSFINVFFLAAFQRIFSNLKISKAFL